MSRFAAVVLVLCLNISSAAPQTGDDIQQAKGEVASELQVCSIYFRIGRSCLSLQEPALARSYGEMSDKVADLHSGRGRIGRGLRRSREPLHRGDDKRDARGLHKHRCAAAKVFEILSAPEPKR
jgi:hypothetical protein